MLRLRLLLTLIIAGVLTLPLQAATITVADSGADYSSIQAAIEAADNGDEIIVSPGTYVENINFNGKAITLRSASGDPADTIIDGGGSGTVVTCDSGEDSNTVIDGFTITKGSAYFGGGMFNTSSSPTVTNCTFSGNTATYYGGGMVNYSDSSPTVTNCTFSDNTASDNGGGMYNSTSSSPTVTNCTFSGNTASDYGGGMYNDRSSPTVTNCILWGDSPDEIYNSISSTLTISFSDLQSGLPANTVDGGGNIDVDPLFVDTDGPDNTAGTGDDNLRLSGGSPCIDAGDTCVPSLVTVATDLDGNLRGVDDPATPNTGVTVVGVTVDMGAYEFGSSPVLCISQLEGDINCDGIVNLHDLKLLALHWLETN